MTFGLGFQFTRGCLLPVATSIMLAVSELSKVVIGPYLAFQIGFVLVKTSGASSFGVPRMYV